MTDSKSIPDVSTRLMTNFKEKAEILGISVICLLAMTMLTSVVCFALNDSMNVQLIPGNLSKTKIVAEVPSSYKAS
jgi:hypothetical protein